MSGRDKMTYVSLLSDESIHEEYEAALLSIEAELGQHHPIYIGERSIASEEEFEVRSPIDSDILIGYFQKGGREHALDAVGEAKRSFDTWSGVDWSDRMQKIRAAADTLEHRKYLLAALITYESGKNRFEAIAEVGEAIDMLRYYCDVYEQQEGYRISLPGSAPDERSRSVMKPHGTWVVISPFNFPLVLAAGACSAALLTGNTVVFKPTSETPFCGLKLYEAFVESGVMPGAINMVTGPGKTFGEAVVAHPDVDGIAFTGSKAVGMWLHRNFALKQPYPKPFIAEMGSKNPTIVTSSADLESAVEGVARAAFGYSGQKCSATSRVYVHISVAQQFTDALRARAEAMAVGDPRERDVFLGPLISQAALETYRESLDLAVRDGGTIISGGEVLSGGLYDGGHYVTPTIVAGLPEGHRIFKEELFVPLVSLGTFNTFEEALFLANSTDYGLTAGIFSGDTEEIGRFFRYIRFGVCYANRKGGATTGAWPGSQPFGGWKASGSTGRAVGGPYYLISFMREQAQTIAGERSTEGL
ncbi:MAG: aldehyde dehydrogenase family protein [Methanomicrobiaceae archaeon]|nr:aldehyde dehydrogenase family protein [Methanomicrobiaceae archaeon]